MFSPGLSSWGRITDNDEGEILSQERGREMKCVVITGASKGLGKSLAKAFLLSSYHVVGISRTIDPFLEDEARKGRPFTFLSWDLTRIESLEDLVQRVVEVLPSGVEEVIIIHNAGEMQPVDSIRNLKGADIHHNFLLNAVSPITLTAAFLRALPSSLSVQMVYISSRSVHVPRKLWAVYGASKASIDHFARVLALEYQSKKQMHVLVIHPPAMDTEMRQRYLKKRSWFFWMWDWIMVHLFRRRKVYDPDLVAWRLLDIIEKRSLASGSVWRWD